MSNVSLSYNVWNEGVKRRSPTPKFTAVTTQSGPTNDDTYPFLVPSTLGGLPLAFVSVSGSANGHYVICNYPNPVYLPTPSDPPPAFNNPPLGANQIMKVNIALNTNVTISVWYLPLGGDGTGQPHAYIDSFNVDTGQFFFDPAVANDFVMVTPDGSLTFNANDTGVVPTAADETITSNAQILNIPFLNWEVMSHSGPGFNPEVSDKALKVYANSSVYAIGFFGSKNKNKSLVNFKDFYAAISHELYPGEAVDAPKPGDGNPPQWRTAVKQLAILMAMNGSMSKVDQRLQASIHAEIVSQVNTLTGGLNKTVQGGKIGR